ncbi:MAG: serine/threonine protein kinase [Cyanobacteria bacterium]|nr:serine/threonine protein kinase [Cyanobacteriota bacterium]MDW8201125.1 serine/threonine protein kinase [Cyanobacteriota bacterium SKYGB_h_bin112]
MRFTYLVYGLCLNASELLPGLVPVEGECWGLMVKLNLGAVPSLLDQADIEEVTRYYISTAQQAGEPSLVINRVGDGYIHLRYADGTQFVLHPERCEIWATWTGQSTLEDTTMYLLGPVLGFFLRLQGIICLHGSAIAVDGHALAILGKPGAGKSTTAAALAVRGYPVLSDDITALSILHGQFYVQPAYPYLKLWSPSVEALYGSTDALPWLTPTWNKQYLNLNQSGYHYQAEPLPLGGIYVLNARSADPSAPWIEPIPKSSGLIELIANTYASKLLGRELRAREFETLSQVAALVPIRKVTPHAEFSYLSALCDSIVEDFRLLIG